MRLHGHPLSAEARPSPETPHCARLPTSPRTPIRWITTFAVFRRKWDIKDLFLRAEQSEYRPHRPHQSATTLIFCIMPLSSWPRM